MKKEEQIIILTYELGWKKPVQAKSLAKNKYGEIYQRSWFSEWETFEEAIICISAHHNSRIVIDRQIKLGLMLNCI